jgi:serine/threonine protein phosphatase PrpC
MIEVDKQWLLLQRVREERSTSYSITCDTNDVEGDKENEEDGEYDTSGCTCCCMLITPNGRAYVSNVGDTRSVMCRDGITVPLSFDQKPTDPRELSRIIDVGGFVSNDGRLGGSVGVARE